MKFSSEEIKKATKAFDVEHLIGEGGFGKVYHARLRHTAAAIKILNQVYYYYNLYSVGTKGLLDFTLLLQDGKEALQRTVSCYCPEIKSEMTILSK